jgi:hypothetical protein
MCSAESKVLTAFWTYLWSAPIVAGFCSRFVLCNIYKTFFRSRHQFYRLMPGEGVRIADNESMGENPNT